MAGLLVRNFLKPSKKQSQKTDVHLGWLWTSYRTIVSHQNLPHDKWENWRRWPIQSLQALQLSSLSKTFMKTNKVHAHQDQIRVIKDGGERTCPFLVGRVDWVKIPLPVRKRTLGQKKKSQLIEMPVGTLPVTMFHFSAFISIIIPSDLFQKHQLSSRRVTGFIGRDLFLFLFPCKLSPWLRMPVSCLAQAHSLWEELQGLVRQRGTWSFILAFTVLTKQYFVQVSILIYL